MMEIEEKQDFTISSNAMESSDTAAVEEDPMIDTPSNPGIDEADTPSPEISISIWDVIWDIISMILHFVDVLVDISLAINYLLDGQHLCFYLTIAILITSSLLSVIISEEMYYNQDRKVNAGFATNKRFIKKPLWQKACYIFILAFQLAPMLRVIDVLKYAMKSYRCKQQGDKTKQKRYYTKMKKEKDDLAVLKVVECVLEAIPQQICQLTILLQERSSTSSSTYVLQVISVCGPLVGMTLTMASYNYTTHEWSILDRSNIREVSLSILCSFLWYFFMPVSRIMVISGTARIWALYTGIYCVIHWLGMTIWIFVYGSKVIGLCRERRPIYHLPLALNERIRLAIFAPVIGVLYVFVFVNPYVGQPNEHNYHFYYAFCCVEDILATILWLLFSNQTCKGVFCKIFECVCPLFAIFYIVGCLVSMHKYE